jgi:hypothetical protein
MLETVEGVAAVRGANRSDELLQLLRNLGSHIDWLLSWVAVKSRKINDFNNFVENGFLGFELRFIVPSCFSCCLTLGYNLLQKDEENISVPVN